MATSELKQLRKEKNKYTTSRKYTNNKTLSEMFLLLARSNDQPPWMMSALWPPTAEPGPLEEQRVRSGRAAHETRPPPVPPLLALLRPSCAARGQATHPGMGPCPVGRAGCLSSEADGTHGSVGERKKPVVTAP